ncbi:MAG: hypothetical protein ACRC1H_19555 [Caldilineaceae bacterium]
MEPIIDRLKAALRAVGPSAWQGIADGLNAGRPEDDRVSVHMMRKIAYGDRDNPRIQTIQPLLDHFGIGVATEDRSAAAQEAA